MENLTYWDNGKEVGKFEGKYWAAKWIEDAAKENPSSEVKEFAANMAMSIRASHKPPRMMVCLNCWQTVEWTEARFWEGCNSPCCQADCCGCNDCLKRADLIAESTAEV